MRQKVKIFFLSSLLLIFTFVLYLNFGNNIKATESDQTFQGNVVLEKKSENSNQVSYELDVENQGQGTLTLSLTDPTAKLLYAENIEEYFNDDIEDKFEIEDIDDGLKVNINFKQETGSYKIPIVLVANSTIDNPINNLVISDGSKTLAQEPFSIKYSQEKPSKLQVKTNALELARFAITPRAATNVSTWKEFTDALANTSVDVINVTEDLTRNSTSATGTISRDLTINGNNHKIDFGSTASNGSIVLGAVSGKKFIVNDALVTKLGSTSIINSSSTSAIWDIQLNNVTTPSSNAAGIIDSTNSTLTLLGTNKFYSTSNTVTVLHIFSNSGAISEVNTTQSSNGLTVWAVAVNDGNMGGGSINLDNATLIAHSTGSSAVRLRYGNNSFTVKNNSKLAATTDYTAGDAATVRFSTNNPDNEFQIDNNSIIDIQHLSGVAPALRLNGDGFITNVTGKSKLNLYNKGSGNSSNNSDEALNLPGTNNTFTSSGKDSQVNMIAESGPAIYGGSNVSKINVQQDTEFIARGTTSGANYGIFNMGANASILINNPIYYDFANVRTGGANIFGLSGSTGSFTATNTDISVWKKGSKVYIDDPVYDWTLLDFKLGGSNLANIVSSSDTGFNSLFGAPNNYSRMSGNNARPVVDKLRQPTNADKTIYGHVSVPEGVEGIRDAWTNEVEVKVRVKNADGSTAYDLSGKTVGEPGISIWGDDPDNGIFQIKLPDDKFFEVGQTVEVIGASRSGANSLNGKVHESLPEDILTGIETTIDVTPPKQAGFEKDYSLTNATKQITGTSDENGAKVFVKVNGSWLKNSSGDLITTTVADNKWVVNLPTYLTKDDKVDVYLKDTTTIDPVPSYNLPKTYTQEPDGVYGNSNEEVDGYDAYTGYHDAIKTATADDRFNSAKRFVVNDVIPDQPNIVKSVVSSGGTIASVGDTLTYTLVTSNKKANSESWKNVVITDVLPEGLKFDSEKSKVIIAGVAATKDQYSYDSSTRTLTINLGDIAANASVTTSFDTVLETAAYNKEIKNKAKASGDSPQEKPFVAGPINPDSTHEIISADSNEVGVPGTTVKGTLSLVSAPEKIDFGKKKTTAYGAFTAEKPSYDLPLIVNDTRPVSTGWSLTVTLNEVMTYDDDSSYKMPDALVYKKGTSETPLQENMPLVILSTAKDEAIGDYNVSDKEWESKGDGFKLVLKASQYRKDGDYTGKMTFTLNNTP